MIKFMMIYLILYMMFLMILNLLSLSLYILFNKFVIFIEFEFFKFLSIKLEYLIYFDWLSILFMLVVLMITFNVIIYSIEYMNNDKFIKRFMIMIILFMMFMIFMIVSPNMLSILLGWDGLGLISYCLVIYYQNEYSFNSGMVTVLTNRIGDSIILMLIGLMMINGSWNLLLMYNLNLFLLFMLMIAAFTKSAQIPFSAWLPKAMAAPTPVSSLVHSSTLVTAGVYLLIRLNYLMKMNLILMKILMLISVLTLFMSGLNANFEFDFKKIIALSTLSQLGLMMFCLSMGMENITFFHLLTHAMFKCLLFMCAGMIIHNMMNNQDIRYINMVLFNMPLISVIFNCSTFSLCGIPFMSGFFSKDLILEMFMMNLFNKMVFIIMFISMGLTVSYSLRLMYYSFISYSLNNIYYKYKSLNSLMFYSTLMLFFMSIFMGFLLSWMIFSMKNLILLQKSLKLIIYLFMMIGFIMGMLIPWISYSLKFLLLMNKYLLFLINMWFLFNIYNMKMFILMNFFQKKFYIIDLKWNEYLFSYSLANYLKNNLNLDLFNKNFYFLMMFIFYMILFMLIY
uniref:NADH-ubiquinone oxidoreductase chain 5 n=1 Tax=Venturia canescens TaxID=32260 RepID=C4NCH7_9HYME|nr:NADH dehydrogenase subunit 5 [Venturia canescens]